MLRGAHKNFCFYFIDEAALLQDALKQRTGMSTVPNVFVSGQHIGGCDDTFKFHDQNKLLPLLGVGDGVQESHPYQYDLVVIGGGSGGLAASKVPFSHFVLLWGVECFHGKISLLTIRGGVSFN